MSAISRRSMLVGLAVAPPAALPSMPATEAASLPAYQQGSSASERLQHHLLMAAAAADELAPGAECRWDVKMFGKAGSFRPSFRVERVDLVREPHPRIAGGILVERRELVASWNQEPMSITDFASFYGLPTGVAKLATVRAD